MGLFRAVQIFLARAEAIRQEQPDATLSTLGRASSLLVLVIPFAGWATPIPYTIDFEVKYIEYSADSRLAVGNDYSGFFVVDSAILESDGINQAGDVSAFVIVMEEVIWSANLPDPLSAFAGFRGPGGLGADSPGFDTLGAEITNVRGGVFGGGDYPFVDFSTSFDPSLPTPPFPTNCGNYCGNLANAFWTINPLGAFGGTMRVHRVPEPSSLTLVLVWVALLVIGHRGRQRRQ
jgi:hypothetical protein